MNRLVWIIILSLQGFGVTSQNQIEVKAFTDTSYYVFGDQILLSLEVSPVNPGVGLSDGIGLMDSLNDDVNEERLGNLEVLEKRPWSISQGIGTTEIILGAFDTGYQFYVCPVLYTQNQITDTLMSEAAFFYIASVQTDSTGIAPIKDILEEPLKLQDFLPYLMGISGIFLLGLLIWLYLRNKKRRKVRPEEIKVYIPPHEIALNKLQELKKQSLWQQGRIKEYQSQLTHIIREYIEEAMTIPALESTSNEIISSLRTRSIDESKLNELSYMLNIADIVKFAKGNPDANVHVELMNVAEQFILQTHQSLKLEEE